MEKKYKHKKNGSTMVYFDGCMKIDNLVIEGTPDLNYWEEVVENKDYKILSQIKNGYFYDEIVEGDGVSSHICSVIDEDKILKVKRLSDGEIFKVGDTIIDDSLKKYKIKSFEINSQWKGGIRVIRGNGLGVAISYINKTKQPIATTEEGAGLYEGDEYYYLHLHSFRIDKATAHKPFFEINTTGKYFSTKEAAEDYVYRNKPTLSLSDVFKVYPQFKKKSPGVLTNHAKELIELAKNK